MSKLTEDGIKIWIAERKTAPVRIIIQVRILTEASLAHGMSPHKGVKP